MVKLPKRGWLQVPSADFGSRKPIAQSYMDTIVIGAKAPFKMGSPRAYRLPYTQDRGWTRT